MQQEKKTYADMRPSEFRQFVRSNAFSTVTCGCCNGFVQANLVILSKKYANDFKLFAQRNPKAIPLLEVTESGQHYTKIVADHADILTDLSGYNVYIKGGLADECSDVKKYWQEDFVCFLIGCSYTFENALISNDIEMRHITDGQMNPAIRLVFRVHQVNIFQVLLSWECALSQKKKLI